MNSASQIWRMTSQGETFKDWINAEKLLFKKKREDKKIAPDMTFDEWLNKRHDLNKNATGDSIKDILMQTAEKLSPTPAPTTSRPTVQKTILGMKPLVFYTLTGTVLFVTGLLIYSKVKSK